MEELDKILGEVKETPQPLEAQAEEQKPMDTEVVKKQQQLENLNKAIQEANRKLKELRTQPKQVEDDLPKIDMEDPSAKAWDRHIRENVNPLRQELDKEKEEVFNFTLREYLEDKPALASNPEKLNAFVTTYEKIKNNSGRTKEGIMLDLDKSFAVVYADELMSQARNSSIRRAQGDALFSDIAVSRGSTAYFKEKEVSPESSLDDDSRAVLAKWGMSPQEWGEMKKKYK